MQGYLIGNGVTDDEFDGNAYLPFAAGKSLITELQLQRATEACNGSFWDFEGGSRSGEGGWGVGGQLPRGDHVHAVHEFFVGAMCNASKL